MFHVTMILILIYIVLLNDYCKYISYRIYTDKYGSIIPHILNTWEISPQKIMPPPHSHHVFADSHDIRFVWDLGEWHHLERCNYCMSLVAWKLPSRKLTWNLKMIGFLIEISSSRASFSGSMLVFGSVWRKTSNTSTAKLSRSLKQVQSGWFKRSGRSMVSWRLGGNFWEVHIFLFVGPRCALFVKRWFKAMDVFSDRDPLFFLGGGGWGTEPHFKDCLLEMF